MSKQRYLLIVLGLLVACSLNAQSIFTVKSGTGFLNDGSENGTYVNNRLTWEQHLTPHLELEISSDLKAADLIIAPNVQKMWHNGIVGTNFKTSGLLLHMDYRNIAFGSSQLLGLYPVWNNLASQDRLLQHQGTFMAEYTVPYLQVQSYAQLKHLRYTPYLAELNMETFEMELVRKQNTGASDAYYGIRLAAPLTKGFSANLAAAYKDGTFAHNGEYRLTGLSAGLSAYYKVLAQADLSSSITWTNRTGMAIDTERRNLLETSIRYRHRVSDALAGYLFYINNSCISSDLDKLYLVSNYLRAQLQYSYPTDPSGGSYLLIGGKYSPENKADAYFAETDYRMIGNLYTGAGVDYQPERQTTFSGKIGYYYTPVNELHLQYSHRKNTHLDFTTETIGFGSSLYW